MANKLPYGANVWWGKILTNLMNQSFIVKIFPINIAPYGILFVNIGEVRRIAHHSPNSPFFLCPSFLMYSIMHMYSHSRVNWMEMCAWAHAHAHVCVCVCVCVCVRSLACMHVCCVSRPTVVLYGQTNFILSHQSGHLRLDTSNCLLVHKTNWMCVERLLTNHVCYVLSWL